MFENDIFENSAGIASDLAFLTRNAIPRVEGGIVVCVVAVVVLLVWVAFRD